MLKHLQIAFYIIRTTFYVVHYGKSGIVLLSNKRGLRIRPARLDCEQRLRICQKVEHRQKGDNLFRRRFRMRVIGSEIRTETLASGRGVSVEESNGAGIRAFPAEVETGSALETRQNKKLESFRVSMKHGKILESGRRAARSEIEILDGASSRRLRRTPKKYGGAGRNSGETAVDAVKTYAPPNAAHPKMQQI